MPLAGLRARIQNYFQRQETNVYSSSNLSWLEISIGITNSLKHYRITTFYPEAPRRVAQLAWAHHLTHLSYQR